MKLCFRLVVDYGLSYVSLRVSWPRTRLTEPALCSCMSPLLAFITHDCDYSFQCLLWQLSFHLCAGTMSVLFTHQCLMTFTIPMSKQFLITINVYWVNRKFKKLQHNRHSHAELHPPHCTLYIYNVKTVWGNKRVAMHPSHARQKIPPLLRLSRVWRRIIWA